MEDKKLNFEKPLLSARHFTSGAAPENFSNWKTEDSVRSVRRPPIYKSELKSGPVSNPGTVPFKWEQIPGRPKDHDIRVESFVAGSYEVPRLPPGRTLRVGKQDFDKASANPFVDKDHARSVSVCPSNVPSSDENVEQFGSFRDGKEEVENFSTGNEDEEFEDALETLSRAESLLINCSLSGLSGLEDPGMELSGNSTIDSQTRDFMMGRFLPAAKAMASETPQHVPRNLPVVHQQPRQLREMVYEKKQPQLRYGPDFALEYSQCNGNRDEESDSDNDGGNFHGKICGLLPGLGLRSSFCLLNPLPGMSIRSRAPMPSLRKSQVSSVGLETSKHQENRKASESKDIPIHHLSLGKVDLPTFRELLAEEDRSKNSGIESPVSEKTLYVDTEHKVRSLHVKSSTSDANGKTELEVKRPEILTDKDQNQSSDSSLVNTENLNLNEKGAKLKPQFQIPDFHIVSSRGDANQKTRIATQESSGREQYIFKGYSMMPEEEFTRMRPKGPLKSKDPKVNSEFLAPPPLPKSPSDSWLGRTLPSISTKNISVHSDRGTWITPKDQASKPKSPDPKWETMVRMTKMQDKHLYFSEDRLQPIPEA